MSLALLFQGNFDRNSLYKSCVRRISLLLCVFDHDLDDGIFMKGSHGHDDEAVKGLDG
jgi:hypothetical protein